MSPRPRGRFAPRLPATRDRGQEEAADQVARGASVQGKVTPDRAPAELGLGLGQPLPRSERAYFERRLGADLSSVRVHPDSPVAADYGAHGLAAGRDIALAPGRWRPGDQEFRRLLGHELAHTIQQSRSGPAIQLEAPSPPLKEAKAEEEKTAVGDGLKKVAEEFGKNEAATGYALGMAKSLALPIWNRASGAERVAAISVGAVALGTPLIYTLSKPEGRESLSGVDFGKVLGLIPHSPVTGLQYDLPKSPTDPFQLRLGFRADDLLGIFSRNAEGEPSMTLGLNFTLSVSPDGQVSMPFAMANFGIAPGISIAGGYGLTTDMPRLEGPAGGPMAPYAAFPQPAQPAPLGGAGFFVTVDLLKLSFLPEAIGLALGAPPRRQK
ncbi:hypothetical protein DDF62_14655 [Caulobacter radicis]|uniref:eCIS core domain-containing protein n=1 Tax=Caulobacter radicis TaxID=2172650 RepID=UPI000D579323|nr:DUF4157 domain-containing protein [Caulobacter radicis]PVM88433.1 hypothetical protein DDF62_14655 [Caulobacter radicis]